MAKRILIADDDPHIRELIQLTLEDDGYEIREASDGNEAVAKAKEFQPDLIILDVMMPGKVGYTACSEIKQDPAGRNAYIILLTARGTSVAKMTGETAGADEFMTKPFEPKALREKIKKILDRI